LKFWKVSKREAVLELPLHADPRSRVFRFRPGRYFGGIRLAQQLLETDVELRQLLGKLVVLESPLENQAVHIGVESGDGHHDAEAAHITTHIWRDRTRTADEL
jgi:hypothetical protein